MSTSQGQFQCIKEEGGGTSTDSCDRTLQVRATLQSSWTGSHESTALSASGVRTSKPGFADGGGKAEMFIVDGNR